MDPGGEKTAADIFGTAGTGTGRGKALYRQPGMAGYGEMGFREGMEAFGNACIKDPSEGRCLCADRCGRI